MLAKAEFLSAVLIVSRNPERLARFYRDVLGIPLEGEEHGEASVHYGCTLGDIHFAIHPVDNFPDNQDGVGAVKLAFTVFDINALVSKLKKEGVALLYELKDKGLFLTTAVQDPDGNYVEFTQLVDEWFEDLEERRAQGLDVVSRWKHVRDDLS